jgi:hypothetical protein
MKSIVVGYSDEAGRSKPTLVCGPEISDLAQAAIFAAAKRNRRFPKGVARLEFAFIDGERTNVAIRIGSEVQGPMSKVQRVD